MKNCNTRFTGGISSGFTLIELIVVIVILGILAVSAAPKFIDLQSDARAATLRGMMGAVKSANSMILGKAVLHGTNTKYSDRETHTHWNEDCSTENCVNIGQMWVYLKYAYIDRNSVAFIIDSDISGKDTKPVTNSATNQKITVPARKNGKGEVQESCTSATNTICEGHDFCQCRINNDTTVPHGSVQRDSQVIVPRGFPYNVSKHPGGGCYFKYTSAEKVNGKIEPVYTLVTSGC
jgi:prepilin-type N-terminal cleavage/methylation domain-containing protein